MYHKTASIKTTASVPPAAPPAMAPVFDLLGAAPSAGVSLGLLPEATLDGDVPVALDGDDEVDDVWLDAETSNLAKPSLSQVGYAELLTRQPLRYQEWDQDLTFWHSNRPPPDFEHTRWHPGQKTYPTSMYSC